MATAMPTALSVEETNHLRAVYLCYRVAPEALRTYFDSKHPQLGVELTNEKPNLETIKGNVLKKYQWDQLYPPAGVPVPTSRDFDITLLICLLRKMKPKTGPPPLGFDKKPEISHTSEGAHLARIKYYRNNRAHSKDGKLSNKDFTDLWNDLKIAIIGLGGSRFGKEINNAETISLDNTLTELLGQLTEYEKQQQEMSDDIKCNLQKINDLETTITTEQSTLKEEYTKKIQEQESNMREISTKVKVLEGQLPYLISDLQEVKETVSVIEKEKIPKIQQDLQEVKETVSVIEKEKIPKIRQDLQELKETVTAIEKEKFPKTQRDLLEIKEDIAALQNKKIDNIPENRRVLIEIELAEWKKFDSAFITTRAADDVFIKIKNNCCVTVTGNSGMGKTVTTRHIALKMITEGFTIIPITHPEEIVNLFSTQKKTLFVVDDLCGKYTLNQSYFDRWKLILATVELLLDKQFCKLISSCRLQVYKDIKFKSLSIFNECECNMNSKNLNLTQGEITEFATRYFEGHSDKAISLSKEYDYFPFLCSLYQKNKNVDFDTFYKNPFQCIGEEIDNLLLEGDEGKYKYCVLGLCVIHNNQLTGECLTGKNNSKMIEDVLEDSEANKGTSTKCLHKATETLVGTFLTKDKDCYRMLHDKLFDYVSYHLGQKMIDTILEHADSAFIRERYVLDTSGKEEEKVAFTINLPDDKVEPYIRRIITDWEHGKIVDFFSNRNLKSLVFTDQLINYLNKRDKSRQTELVTTVDTGKFQDTPLIRSCYTGNLKLTHWILGHGVNVNQCRSDGVSALCMACQEGYVDIVRELLQYKQNNRSPLYRASRKERRLMNDIVKINLSDDVGRSPLYTACNGGYLEVVRELLQHKPDINKSNKRGWSPLYIACDRRYVEVVRELLQHKPDINKCNDFGRSALYTACYGGHIEVVRELLKHKPDINKYGKYGESPLFTACNGGHVEVVRELLKHKPDVNKCNRLGGSPLYIACCGGYVEIVRELLKHKPDINKCHVDGKSPLYIACGRANVEVVRKLLKHKPDINKCNKRGGSPLYIACCGGNVEVVRELLQHKPDIDKCDVDGKSPLYRACGRGNVEVVRELLHLKADVNRSVYTGMSPLFIATVIGNEDIVTMLIKNGSDVNKCVSSKQVFCDAIIKYNRDTMYRYKKWWTGFIKRLIPEVIENIDGIFLDKTYGSSPLHMACLMGHINIVNLLLEKHTDINVTNEEGATPLFLACQVGHSDVVTILLKRGADVSICRKDGQLPSSIAFDNKHASITSLLSKQTSDLDN